MEGYDKQTYGERWAPLYDQIYAAPDPATVDLLAGLAQGGPALELAVGTGRVALPLADRGIEVHGVEVSGAMLERLRAKPGGGQIRIVASDIADFRTERTYPLIFLAFNSLFGLVDPGEQASCLRAVAGALAPEGRFVTECFVPDLDRYDRGQRVDVQSITLDRAHLTYNVHHPGEQRIDAAHDIRWADRSSTLLPVSIRYLFPGQLDKMAAEAGLVLERRLEWYDETPFTDASPRHVSIFRRS